MSWNIEAGLTESNFPFITLPGIDQSPTETTLALNTSYTYGTSGNAIALIGFSPCESANLTDFWFKVKSYGGTWASTDGNINYEIREGLNGNRIPGTSSVASGTVTLDGTTGWKRVTGLTHALTANKAYWLILYDSDGGATNYVTIVVRYGTNQPPGVRINMFGEVGTTTNGFSTGYTSVGASPAACVKVGNQNICGNIFDTQATITSSTNERGIRFKVPENCTFIGWSMAFDSQSLVSTQADIFKLYADATSPGGTTLASITKPSVASGSATAPKIGGYLLPSSSWVSLTKDEWYRATRKPGVADTIPRKLSSGGSPDSTLLAAAMPFGGNFYRTDESGGAWSDTTNELMTFSPILIPNADTAGGGTAGVVGS